MTLPRALLNLLKLALLALPVAVYMVAQQSRLHDAVKRGDLEQVRAALKPWKEIDAMDREAMTPLSLAVRARKAEIALFLIERGADPLPAAAQDDYRQPLYQVAQNKDPALTQALLAKGLSANSKFVSGKSWLAAAVEKRDAESVALLLKAGADPNAAWTKGDYGASPLTLALTGWEPKDIDLGLALAEALIAAGARVSGNDAILGKAVRQLLFAKRHDTGAAIGLERLKLVVERGYPLEAASPKDSLLALAAFAGNLDAVKYLLSKGADPMGGARPCREPKCPLEGTPLHRIAERSPMPKLAHQDREIAERLVAAGADAATRDQYGRTPADLTARSKNEAVLAVLEAANPQQSRDAERGLAAPAETKVQDQKISTEKKAERPLYAGHPSDPSGSNPRALLAAAGSEVHAVLVNRSKQGTIDVEVTAQGKALTLLLAAYNTTEWRIAARPGVALAKIIVIGREPQRITGQPQNVELVVRSEKQHQSGAQERVWYNSDRGELRRAMERITEITGAAPKTVVAKHELEKLSVDGLTTDVQLAEAKPGPASAVVFETVQHQGKLSADKLTVEYCCAGASSTVPASRGYRKGKRYFEARLNVPFTRRAPETWTNIGIIEANSGHPHISGGENSFIAFAKGDKYRDGDVFGIAIDFDDRYAYFHVNGKWISGEPGSQKGMKLPRWGELQPAVSVHKGDSWTANFGATPFKHPPPAGYGAYIAP